MQTLIQDLKPKVIDEYMIDDENFDHTAFLHGKNIREQLYDRIINLIKEIESGR